MLQLKKGRLEEWKILHQWDQFSVKQFGFNDAELSTQLWTDKYRRSEKSRVGGCSSAEIVRVTRVSLAD